MLCLFGPVSPIQLARYRPIYALAIAIAVKTADMSEEEAENENISSEVYRVAIEKIIHLKDITIEVVGFWIWVTGNTKPVRSILKTAGFFYASKKVAWYFRSDEFKTTRGSKKSLEELKAKYGSEVVKSRTFRSINNH